MFHHHSQTKKFSEKDLTSLGNHPHNPPPGKRKRIAKQNIVKKINGNNGYKHSTHCPKSDRILVASEQTLARGARQLVVQLALETTSMFVLYVVSFTPTTNIGASADGAEITTFLAPPCTTNT